MSTFVVAEVSITDAAGYEAYKPLAEAAIRAYGGTYVVRGGHTVSMEGEPVSGRIVILEFPDNEAATAWYESTQYQTALAIRLRTATSRLYFVDGP